MFFTRFEMSSRKEDRIVTGRGDGKVPSPGVHPENSAHPPLGFLTHEGNVKFVAPSLAATFVDELRGLHTPLRRLQITALEGSATVGELLAAFHRRDRDDAFVWVETEVSATRAAFEVETPLRELGRFVGKTLAGLHGLVSTGDLADRRANHLSGERRITPHGLVGEFLECIPGVGLALKAISEITRYALLASVSVASSAV